MSVEKPPPIGTLASPTREIEGWAQHVPSDILKLDRKSVRAWHDALTTVAHAVNLQVTAAQGLRINEGDVGKFVSATETATKLNESADEIRRRLNEFAKFVTTLQSFSEAAYNAILKTDE